MRNYQKKKSQNIKKIQNYICVPYLTSSKHKSDLNRPWGRYVTLFIVLNYTLGIGKLVYALEILINMETEYYFAPTEYFCCYEKHSLLEKQLDKKAELGFVSQT